MDGIDYTCLKKLPPQYKLLLLDVFNEMYTHASYPVQWSEQYLHFIPKAGGKGVRPIALTSCLCKLMETLMKNGLQWWAEKEGLLPNSQSGLRKGRSCHDNLVNLLIHVEANFGRMQETLVAFLDVKSAFDDVNSVILLNKLSEKDCR